ncbi:lytic murein transglycosylase [Paraglaciecola sp. 2405UD69-4]|uniref:lytic murein transglycosylase n=1 Tax=Paraglaciecola sp. 2405UD69-4 TaxID=3391836 RepID=UPI0039C8F6F2
MIKSLGQSLIQLVISLLLVVSCNSYAKKTFEVYVEDLKQEAISQGHDPELVEAAFSKVTYRKSVVKADKSQPETKITLDSYLATRVPDWKVKQAVKLLNENKQVLDAIEKQYGVQQRFIVALWGNESNFGKFMGRHPVFNSLTTLAYDGRREAFFKKQIFAALSIIEQGHIKLEDFVGSWAGAMGQTQFMPSSFLNYAVDFDGDGKKDIWSNKADVFASIANYLKSEGWSKQLTWGRQVSLSDDFDKSHIGLARQKMKTLNQWSDLGVKRYNGETLPIADIKASVIAPDGLNGRVYLVYENFHTLMKWNRSSYFGVSVSYLSERINKGF